MDTDPSPLEQDPYLEALERRHDRDRQQVLGFVIGLLAALVVFAVLLYRGIIVIAP